MEATFGLTEEARIGSAPFCIQFRAERSIDSAMDERTSCVASFLCNNDNNDNRNRNGSNDDMH